MRNAVTEASPYRSVAIIATYISDYIFPGVLREMETVLSRNNCAPSLFATQNQVANERKILQTLLSMPVDGILVEGTKSALPNPNLDLYQQLMAKGIPLVFFHGAYAQLPGAPFVLDDNAGGGRMLTEYLLKKGHRHIAGIFKSDDIQGARALCRLHRRPAGCRDSRRRPVYFLVQHRKQAHPLPLGLPSSHESGAGTAF